MEIYIWERLDSVSENYHKEGGLVVVARDIDHVKELVMEYNSKFPDPVIDFGQNIKHCTVYQLSEEVRPWIFVFPDAGCC